MNIAFVPVRSGSKSIPLKNIKNFCNKPLIYWCLQALQKCSLVDIIFVASDSEKIDTVIDNFNFSKVNLYKRNPKNAKDTSSTESVMLEFLSKKKFDNNDLFILVQATSPLTTENDFTNALRVFKSKNADSLITCVRSKKFIWSEDGNPINYDYMNRPLRQNFRGYLTENGAFYINSIKNIKKNKNRISGKIVIYEMDEFKGIELDEEEDWIIAENLMQKYLI